MRDLYDAAEAGQLVRRIDFENRNADYGGIAISLRQWAPTNNVRIILTRGSPQGLSVFVRSSDARVVSNYLHSLTVDALSPFE